MLDYRRVLVETVDAFDEEHGTDTLVPALRIEDGAYTPVEADGTELVSQEEYRLRLGDAGMDDGDGRRGWTEERLKAHYRDCLLDLYGQAAASYVEEAVDTLEDRYGAFETEIKVDEVTFEEGRSTAAYNRGDATVKLPPKYLTDVDPLDGEADGDGLWSSCVHEAAHALHFGSSGAANTLKDHISDTNGEDASYKDDVRRAAMEAITKYEEPLPGSSRVDHDATLQALEDPWQLPELDVEPEGLYSDDPYELGHLAAYAAETAFKADHESAEAELLTREFLLHGVTTPEGLEGVIDSSFAKRDIRNYPGRFQHWYSELDAADDLETRSREVAIAIDRELGSCDLDGVLDGYIEGRAFLDALDKAMDDGDRPHRVQELETTLETAANVMGS